jgi:uncharacterized protein YcbX
MTLAITNIYRHPVKGLTPEPLERVDLAPGEGLPHDRRFAIAHGATRFDPAAPEWMPKTNFLMLMKDERLAKLRTRFDDATGILTVERDGKTVARASLEDQTGRTVLEQFFGAYLKAESRGAPKIVAAPGHMFSDVAAKVVSIIGLASIGDLERVVRAPVDPRRFRANVYFAGGRPWEEMQWVGRQIAIGPVTLEVVKPITRCAATNVNPETAERDLNLPLALQKGFGHPNMGIYARVVSAGAIAVGDAIAPGDAIEPVA